MLSLKEELSNVFGDAFESIDLPRELGLVRLSDRPDLAQFQCNGAMAAAKVAKKAPRDIASSIVEKLKNHTVISNLDIAGPGFINIHINDRLLSKTLTHMMTDERAGAKTYGSLDDTIVLDYGGPNAAKAMHVGHLRPTIIGDCVKRLCAFAGYNALGDVHMGDWGLPIGQIITYLKHEHPDWPYFDEAYSGEYPAEPPFSFTELETIYPAASAKCKDNKDFLEEARLATADLQNGRAGYIAMWKHIMTLSKADMKRNFDSLDVTFDLWKGEADVAAIIPDVEQDLKDKSILAESDGAHIIHVKRDDDQKEMPPLMFYKSDGAVTYGTTDLATIYDRIKTHDNITHIIYITDKRQSLHFEQLFRASGMAGYTDNISLKHIGFGTLNGPDGKPFKTREGGIMRLDTMVKNAREKAQNRLSEADLAQDFPDEEKENIARCVALASLKFADLINQSHVDYIFNLDQMTRFEGKTGPYLLYQAVRIQSLMRKSKDQNISTGDTVNISNENDRELGLVITEFPDVFEQTYTNLSPHVMCEYGYKLASSFSKFYAACHILSEEDEKLRNSRLALCKLTHKILLHILGLLGIPVPERM